MSCFFCFDAFLWIILQYMKTYIYISRCFADDIASMLNHDDLLAGELIKLEAEGAVFEREGDILVFGDGFYCAYAREIDLKAGIVNGQDILDDLDARAALDGRCVECVEHVAVVRFLLVEGNYTLCTEIGFERLFVTEKLIQDAHNLFL